MGARRRSIGTQLGLLAFAAVLLSQGALAAQQTAIDEVVARRELVTAALEWLDATLARDFAAQSAFYPETMDAFYLWRDVPKSAVLAEKRRVFEQARTIDISMEPPQVLIDSGARTGRMYFRKTYAIEGKGKLNRTGEVLQELRWAREEDGWKIVSERDLRVIRQARRGR
jgi:hypothetical protein